jgi:hypothetical protein
MRTDVIAEGGRIGVRDIGAAGTEAGETDFTISSGAGGSAPTDDEPRPHAFSSTAANSKPAPARSPTAPTDHLVSDRLGPAAFYELSERHLFLLSKPGWGPSALLLDDANLQAEAAA